MAVAETEVITHRAGVGSASGLPDADPITTEVIRHGPDAAADQMRIVLRRTAFSSVIYEMTDFAAALYDTQLRLLAQAQALPVFLGTMSFCVESAVEKVGGPEALEPGDTSRHTPSVRCSSVSRGQSPIDPA
jgi:N-methylhydantoinase B